MTPKAQRITIAEACGWKGPMHPDTLNKTRAFVSPSSAWCLDPTGNLASPHTQMPDYPNDLNAMHEAVSTKFKTEEERRQYVYTLCELMPPGEFTVLATAAQRAEALLRCLNLWRD